MISVTIFVTACYILFHLLKGLDVDGVIKALRATDRRAVALAAGCDVLPICNDRHSVELALDALGAGATSAASQARLVRMRARGEPKADLRSSRRWQETTARIADLFSTPPPLVLTEGQS